MEDRARAGFDAGLLTLAMAAVTTVVFYRFGVDNHVSELPLVLRAMDPGFLAHDFYTNASAGPGPRFRFTHLMAAMASAETLPGVYLGLALLANVAIAAISFFVARNAFSGSHLAGAGAAALVMSLSTFRLGYAPELYVSQLLSSRLVLPFVLLALAGGLEGRVWLAAVAGGCAAWIHPSFGLEGGGLAVLLAGIGRRQTASGAGGWRSTCAAAVVFAGLALAGIWPALEAERIDPAQFLAIETLFRHPQHNLLSAQSLSDGLRAGIFLLVATLALLAWRRLARPEPVRANRGTVLLLGLAIACLLGALAFELAPNRWLALARPLRGLAVVRWWGLVLIGGAIGLALQRGYVFDPRYRVRTLGALAAAALWIVGSGPSAGAWLCLVASCSTIGLLYATANAGPVPRIATRTAVAAASVALLVQLVWLPAWLPEAWLQRTERLRPALALDAISGDRAEIARWARLNTPPEAVFLTPPDAGWFRLWAERAVVVDFKAFPFRETAMPEWRRRIADCYGPTRNRGWQAARDLALAYAASPPETRAAANCRYAASHALIEGSHVTSQPALVTVGRYRIVELP